MGAGGPGGGVGAAAAGARRVVGRGELRHPAEINSGTVTKLPPWAYVEIDAALIAMPDAFDEVYQGVMQNPTSSDAVQRLQQAVERMRVEDELGAAVDEDLASLFKQGKAGAAPRQAGARARRQSA